VRPGGSTCHGDPCAVSSVTRKYSMPPAQDAAATPTVNVFRVARVSGSQSQLGGVPSPALCLKLRPSTAQLKEGRR